MSTQQKEKIREEVKEYYGKTLTHTDDLKTSACCTSEKPNSEINNLIKDIHEEVKSKYYGCGLVAPELLQNTKILDLGSGSGRDAYLLSRLVGAKGSVVGIDMTDEQLDVAKKHVDFHTKAYGYTTPNISFKKGFIESLDDLGFGENQFDLIVSNCVLNLSVDKEAVLRGVYKLLKNGGEMYFSDVYADRRISEELQKNPVLYGECLSGALYDNDFIRIAKKVGFMDPRIVKSTGIEIYNPEIKKITGEIQFQSITYRLFKIPDLEDACEDFGQSVIYKGTIPDHPHAFNLDDHHHFETGRSATVCGNTYKMLKDSRFSEHFSYTGDMNVHFGAFPCEPSTSKESFSTPSSTTSCC